MHARALGVRDIMKLMGVVNLQAPLDVKLPSCCSFPYKHRCLTTRFYGISILLLILLQIQFINELEENLN